MARAQRVGAGTDPMPASLFPWLAAGLLAVIAAMVGTLGPRPLALSRASASAAVRSCSGPTVVVARVLGPWAAT